MKRRGDESRSQMGGSQPPQEVALDRENGGTLQCSARRTRVEETCSREIPELEDEQQNVAVLVGHSNLVETSTPC